jgi:hypothetical protein
VLTNNSETHTACIFRVEDMDAGKRRHARLLPPLNFWKKSILIREENISNINIKIEIIIKKFYFLS